MKAQMAMEATRKEFADNLARAMRDNNEDDVAKAFTDFFKHIESDILSQATEFDVTQADKALFAQRGLRVLTSDEESYFKGFIEAGKSGDVEKALTDFSKVLPESEFVAIFEDMKKAHPLLNVVNFVDTAALTKFIMETSEAQKAAWGELNSAITKEIEGSVDVVTLTLNKLTAYMFMSNDMLDLGPVWVEKYVRTLLAEALSLGCEDGIINGTGVKGQPIGMIRQIGAGVDVNSETGYPEKTPIKITDFSPKTYGNLLSKMAVDEKGKARVLSSLILIVNPADNYQKVMPATTLLRQTGYERNVFPVETKIVQSAAVASGKAILGVEKKYFFGLGAGTSGGKITADKSFKLLDDLTTFVIKMYGNGRAKDNNIFQYLDISGLKELKYPVQTEALPAE